MDPAALAAAHALDDDTYWASLAETNSLLTNLFDLPALERWPVADRACWSPVHFTWHRALTVRRELARKPPLRPYGSWPHFSLTWTEHFGTAFAALRYLGPRRQQGLILFGPDTARFVASWTAGRYPRLHPVPAKKLWSFPRGPRKAADAPSSPKDAAAPVPSGPESLF